MQLNAHLPQKIGELGQACWNLGGTFRRTFWQLNTDLPERTTDPSKIE